MHPQRISLAWSLWTDDTEIDPKTTRCVYVQAGASIWSAAVPDDYSLDLMCHLFRFFAPGLIVPESTRCEARLYERDGRGRFQKVDSMKFSCDQVEPDQERRLRGKALGSRAGAELAARMTPDQRRERSRKGAAARWGKP